MNSREEVPEEERQIEAALEVANKYESTPAMIIIIIITRLFVDSSRISSHSLFESRG